MALAAPPSGSPWSVVAAVTGAPEESCTTALLLADGDINHAAELILSGVQRLQHAMRRDEDGECEDHDADEHPRERAAPPRPLLLHG